MQTVEMATGDTHTLRSQTSMLVVETLGTLVGHCSAFSRDESAVNNNESAKTKSYSKTTKASRRWLLLCKLCTVRHLRRLRST